MYPFTMFFIILTSSYVCKPINGTNMTKDGENNQTESFLPDTITNIMEAEAEDLDYEESLKMV